MTNMFAQAWRVPAKTSIPVITQEPIPIIETPVGPDINLAIKFKD